MPRVAWIGPHPTGESGVQGVGTLLIAGLVRAGHEIDCYTTASSEELPPVLAGLPSFRLIRRRPSWKWDRWYSRRAVSVGTFVSLQLSRAGAQRLLVRALLERHRAHPYDVIYQYSQIELLGLRRHLSSLPPLVLHPQVHAGGELRWLRAEASLSRRCEPPWRHAVAVLIMRVRSRAQTGDSRRATRVIAPSSAFAGELARDYGVDPGRIRVIPDPIDTQRFHPAPKPAPAARPRILFVSRLAVRKGVEMVAELARRMPDVDMTVVGHPSLWSDYSGLLDGLRAEIHGETGADEVAELMRAATLLIVPSHYEPFGLTVAEAMASGLPVVASDVVGAAERLAAPACEQFAAGDIDAAEAAVRTMLARVRDDPAAVAADARSQAIQHFAATTIAAEIAGVLQEAIAT
jgi:glycosyltransferase involved in cell wall biosynthesis